MSVDARLEHSVLAEFAVRERRARRHDRSHPARVVAEKLHRGRDELLAHLRRVAHDVPSRFRAVAWLHHACQARATPSELATAGLTRHELRAIELLATSRQRVRSAPPWIAHERFRRRRDERVSSLGWSHALRSRIGSTGHQREPKR